MSPRSRRALHRGRAAAVTAGATTALLAFLPAAGAAPGLHPGWEPVLAGARADDRPAADPATVSSRPLLRSVPDPDLLAATTSSVDDGVPGDSSHDDSGYDPYDDSYDDFYDDSYADYGSDRDDDSSALSARSRPATGASSPLATNGIPSTAIEAYTRAVAGHADCGISWTLVAAVGRVESNHGRFAGATLHTDGLSTPPIVGIPLTGNGTARILDSDGGQFDGDTVHDRAVGPMQFIPTTWASYGADGNGDGRRDPFNLYDAAAAAARYLCAAGKDLSTVAGQRRAVFAYNHSDSYVASVLSLAATYAGTPPPSLPTVPGPAPAVPPVDPGRPPAPDPAQPVLPAWPITPPVTLPPVEVPPVEVPPVTLPPVEVPPVEVPPVTLPPVEVPPVEGPPVEVPPVEAPPVEAPPVETPPVEGPPVETPPVEAPPVEAPPVEVPPVEVPPVETPAPTPTPTPPPAPTPAPCGTEAEPTMAAITVDVVDGSGDQALADGVVAALTAGGLTVAGTTSSAEATASGIGHPEGEADDARLLAEALGMVDLLRIEAVERVTVVLGATDSAELVEAIRAFTGVPCPAAPAGATS